jgi:hypothetical protein
MSTHRGAHAVVFFGSIVMSSMTSSWPIFVFKFWSPQRLNYFLIENSLVSLFRKEFEFNSKILILTSNQIEIEWGMKVISGLKIKEKDKSKGQHPSSPLLPIWTIQWSFKVEIRVKQLKFTPSNDKKERQLSPPSNGVKKRHIRMPVPGVGPCFHMPTAKVIQRLQFLPSPPVRAPAQSVAAATARTFVCIRCLLRMRPSKWPSPESTMHATSTTVDSVSPSPELRRLVLLLNHLSGWSASSSTQQNPTKSPYTKGPSLLLLLGLMFEW